MSQFHRNGRMVGLALVMWQVHVTLFASWGNRFEAQRRPAERRVDDQGMPMTETRLDVLCLNSCLHPPANSRYLAEVKQFYVSRMHTFWGGSVGNYAPCEAAAVRATLSPSLSARAARPTTCQSSTSVCAASSCQITTSARTWMVIGGDAGQRMLSNSRHLWAMASL